MNKQLLIEILSLPSVSQKEKLIRNFILSYGLDNDYKVMIDLKKNIYLTKGVVAENEYYPCVMAHMDTVHSDHLELIEKGLKKIIIEKPISDIDVYETSDEKILQAINPITNKQTGIGGDDLAGVFMALETMTKFEKIKAAFFIGEEICCLGSRCADVSFFNDIGYVISFDAPGTNIYAESCSGVKLYNEEFDKIVNPILTEAGPFIYGRYPFTDVMEIRKQFNICCANMPAGYYLYHSSQEYVKISDVERNLDISADMIKALGNKKYFFEKQLIY